VNFHTTAGGMFIQTRPTRSACNPSYSVGKRAISCVSKLDQLAIYRNHLHHSLHDRDPVVAIQIANGQTRNKSLHLGYPLLTKDGSGVLCIAAADSAVRKPLVQVGSKRRITLYHE
jgi:hypothetical protein